MITSKIQFKTNAIAESLAYERAAKACIVLIAVFGLLYAYALGSTVNFVIKRSAFLHQSEQLTSNIASLESKYIKMTQNVTLEKGQAIGLHEAKKISFVTRGDSNVSFLPNVDSHEF